MFNKSDTYSEDQLLDIVQLYNQLKFQFLLNKSYGQALLTRLNYGDQLTAKEVDELSRFMKISETMDTIADIAGRCCHRYYRAVQARQNQGGTWNS
jgi:hypothetical protein